MSDLSITLVLCVAVSIIYAGAALIQARLGHLTVRELTRVPMWWAAQGLNGAGAALHVLSLGFGPLALIQPLGVLTLVIAVPVAAATAKRRVTGLELSGMTCTVGGLAGLTVIIATSGHAAALGDAQLFGLLAVATVAVSWTWWRGRQHGASTVWEAAGGGLAYSVCSALCQTAVLHFSDEGPSMLLQPLTIFTIIAIVGFAIAATVLTQRSYRDGLGAPLAVTNLVNPVSATIIGVAFLGEDLGATPISLTLAVLFGMVAAFGVTQLARARAEEPVTATV